MGDPQNGELPERKRPQDGQKKRYKDTYKAALKDFNIPIESFEQADQDRSKLRCLINNKAVHYEESVKLKESTESV